VQGTSGTADPPLTPHGRAQAARLVAAVGAGIDGGVAGLYASPMARARETAEPLATAPAYVDVPAFTARVTSALERVAAAHEGRATAVVVAHAGVINTWLAHLLGIARPLAFPLDDAGITRVSAARDGRRSVRTVNEIAHVADLLAPVAGTADVDSCHSRFTSTPFRAWSPPFVVGPLAGKSGDVGVSARADTDPRGHPRRARLTWEIARRGRLEKLAELRASR
jgi:2,3-bisphosphoglycerate-dependent phosphoglycerate mutase